MWWKGGRHRVVGIEIREVTRVRLRWAAMKGVLALTLSEMRSMGGFGAEEVPSGCSGSKANKRGGAALGTRTDQG